MPESEIKVRQFNHIVVSVWNIIDKSYYLVCQNTSMRAAHADPTDDNINKRPRLSLSVKNFGPVEHADISLKAADNTARSQQLRQVTHCQACTFGDKL